MNKLKFITLFILPWSFTKCKKCHGVTFRFFLCWKSTIQVNNSFNKGYTWKRLPLRDELFWIWPNVWIVMYGIHWHIDNRTFGYVVIAKFIILWCCTIKSTINNRWKETSTIPLTNRMIGGYIRSVSLMTMSKYKSFWRFSWVISFWRKIFRCYSSSWTDWLTSPISRWISS